MELNFYLNGENLNTPVYGIKGTVFPVFFGESILETTQISCNNKNLCSFSVDDGAIVDVIFDKFRCSDPPPGFDRIMVEKALL